MNDAFDSMIANFQRILDEGCAAQHLDISLEGLYSTGSTLSQDPANALDRAVEYLLDAALHGVGEALYTENVLTAKEIVGNVLKRFKDEQCGFSRQGTTVYVHMNHDTESNFFTDLTCQISRGGLFVATYDILKEGTPLDLLLRLPGSRAFPLQGSVSWVREHERCAEGTSPGMGIAFHKLSAEPAAAIHRYMSKRPPLLFEALQ